MDKNSRRKLNVLESRKMFAEVNAENNAKFYKVYQYLPLIFFILTTVAFLTWGLIDSFIHEEVASLNPGTPSDATKMLYGIWKCETRFHVYASWTLIGALLGGIVAFLTKVFISVRIMTMEYLKIIAINEDIKELKEIAKSLPPEPEE